MLWKHPDEYLSCVLGISLCFDLPLNRASDGSPTCCMQLFRRLVCCVYRPAPALEAPQVEPPEQQNSGDVGVPGK
jgi:hypothetical protein